jgi:hypothetical protein
MKRPIKPIVGLIALIVAIIGLVGSIFGPDIAEWMQPTPPVEEKIADLTVRIKDGRPRGKSTFVNAKVARRLIPP